MTEAAFEAVNPAGCARILLLCDHATNRIPPPVYDLGLPPEQMARHIAWDIGARGVTLGLAGLLDAPALLTRFSRLVIDPNRGEDDPTLIMRLYDGTVIPGNRHLTADDARTRLETWHRPYHAAVEARLDAMSAEGRTPAIVSIHSYTPQLVGRAPRPWQVGILWHHDGRIARPLIDRLRAGGLTVGDNEPYSGQLEGDTLSRHGTARNLPHVLIEVRQDLIGDAGGQTAWAARLAPILTEVIEELPDG